jgi:uncharacterized protein YacL (UPF0231 family)
MELSNIQDFLTKYRTLLTAQDDRRKDICRIIGEASGIIISEKEITVRKGELCIQGDSVMKNEIFLHKKHILDALNKNGITNIFDIR